MLFRSVSQSRYAARQDEGSPNLHRPELICWRREFQYPTNIVSASTGVPSVAVAWDFNFRHDKAILFNEVGFLVGMFVVRPKVYLKSQRGSVINMMDSGQYWLAAVQNDNFELGYKKNTQGTGPFGGVITGAGNDYWMDVRDLFLNGDQFVNYAMDSSSGAMALPTVAGQRRYAASADIDGMYNAASPANQIYMDGALNLSIAGHQRRRVSGTQI